MKFLRSSVVLSGIALAIPLGGIVLFKNKIKPSKLFINEVSTRHLLPVVKNVKDLPGRIWFPEARQALQVKYTINPEIQKLAEGLLEQYKPDHGAIVLLNASTGEVLAMADRTKSTEIENLSLYSKMPTASMFKVITAAAAIEERVLSPSSEIPFTGALYTLYKRNLTDSIQRWANVLTMQQALAKSVNIVFGKIGLFHVGAENLEKYADRAGFNQELNFEMPLEKSRLKMPDSRYGVAELASGFGHYSEISPLHAAWIAATIVNGGKAPSPHLISSLESDKGTSWGVKDRDQLNFIQPTTSHELASMMEETVRSGTGRKTFRGFAGTKFGYKVVQVGGKTGNLTGFSPRGRYDWFMGFLRYVNPKGVTENISIAALTINEKFWTVKSGYLARRMFEKTIEESYRGSEEVLRAPASGLKKHRKRRS